MFYLYNLIMYFGLGVLLTFLPVFFTTETILTSTQVTMMMSFAPIISIFSTNTFAFVSDKTKKYKTILIMAMSLAIASSILLVTVAQYNIPVLIVTCYVLFSFFMNSPSALSDNFILQFSNVNNIPYGRIRLFGSLGYAVAGQVAGYLTNNFGLSIIFVVYAICMILPLVIVPKFPDIEDSNYKNIVNNTNHKQSILKNLFNNKKYLFILIISFFILSSIQATKTFFGLYITEYAHLGLPFLGTTTLISAGTEIPMMFFSDKLIKKFGPYKIIAVAAFLNFVRFFTYFLFPYKFAIIVVTLTHGVGYGSTYTSVMHLINRHVPSNVRASAISINSTLAVGLGSFIISFIGSLFFNSRSIYIVLAIFQFLGLALCLYTLTRSKKYSSDLF